MTHEISSPGRQSATSPPASSAVEPLLDAVERIRPIIVEHAAQAEAERALAAPVYDAMRDAGLFRTLAPRTFGGLELHPTEAYRVWEAVSRIDSAAGWSLQISSSASLFAFRLPTAGGEEVFARGPDTIFAGAFFPPGLAVRVQGGWRVTARTPIASGCNRAHWFAVPIVEVDDERSQFDPTREDPPSIVAYVPRDEVDLIDTWHTVGMRGTFSGDVSVDDVFVPDHRVAYLEEHNDPAPAFSGPLYPTTPWPGIHGETIVSLGVAAAAIDKLVDLAARKTPGYTRVALRDREMAQHHAGKARALVDASRDSLHAAISEAYRDAERDRVLSEAARMRCQLAACFGAEACVQAVDLVCEAAGITAIRIEHGIVRHHRVLKDAVAANGGHEVKWLGDGLMVAFPSAADAVRCAIAMQQGARRPAAGARLAIRVGLHVGEPLREETDYFGTSVVIARRLCDQAQGGQILCSQLVAGLLAGREAFHFRDCGPLELKGIALPVAGCEVLYAHDPAALLRHTPFVGREEQLGRLEARLGDVRAGHGGLVMLVGEPGIGKTRTAEEFAERTRQEGAVVLWGHCDEGEWAPPYEPFAEAIADYGRRADPAALRDDLGLGAAPLARLVPALRERVPDIPEPVSLQPDEERVRLFDAVAQFLIALSVRAPVVLVLDDLHWADKGTIAMLRHVARVAARHRLLLLGAYRDVELDRQHPLADALGDLRRQTTYDRLLLKGLDAREVGLLLETLADRDVPETLVTAISAETDGNPFFIREVLLHLVEEGKIFRQQERWTSDLTIEEMGIPEGIRQVIGRRLSRLSADTNQILGVAAAFNGIFRFAVAVEVAALDEARGLRAIDEALAAQLLRPGGEADAYDFTHALIRHTLYAELSPSRQVRLHRQIAEAMERVYGDRVSEHAAEVAYQYARSAALPGAERGAPHAIAAADRAEVAYAHDDAATFLRMALELLPEGDARCPRLLGRLGLALTWALDFEGALEAARDAGDRIAGAEGENAAADYLGETVSAMLHAGFVRGWALAARGLRHAGERRDATWASLMLAEILRQQAEDPDNPGITVETAEYRELDAVLERITLDERKMGFLTWWIPVRSRADVLTRLGDEPMHLLFCAGEYRRSLPLWEESAARAERQGQIADAVLSWAEVSRCRTALGDFAAACAAYDRGAALAVRLVVPSMQMLNLAGARDEMRLARDEGWEEALAEVAALGQEAPPENRWVFAVIQAVAARVFAHLGRADEALTLLGALPAALERGDPAWNGNYTAMACEAAATLWLLGRTEHLAPIERNVREKIVAPDFRYPMRDGRLSLARVCALQRRYDEAAEWFTRARAVLDEQGARPLRAIADLDQALMYLRRGSPGDRERARPFLDVALQQFRTLGMTGWIRRAQALQPDQVPATDSSDGGPG